jgi:hypothetical protein
MDLGCAIAIEFDYAMQGTASLLSWMTLAVLATLRHTGAHNYLPPADRTPGSGVRVGSIPDLPGLTHPPQQSIPLRRPFHGEGCRTCSICSEFGWAPLRMMSTISGARRVSRSTFETYDLSIFSAAASSAMEENVPVSRSVRQRCARASALISGLDSCR